MLGRKDRRHLKTDATIADGSCCPKSCTVATCTSSSHLSSESIHFKSGLDSLSIPFSHFTTLSSTQIHGYRSLVATYLTNRHPSERSTHLARHPQNQRSGFLPHFTTGAIMCFSIDNPIRPCPRGCKNKSNHKPIIVECDEA